MKDFIRKNQPDEASKYYYELLKLDQEKNPYYDFYYIEILKEKRNYRQALEVAKRLCENFETYARSYYELALVQFFTRRELDAIKTLKTYFKYDMGEHAKGDSLLISCYINLGKYEKAEQALLEAENYLRPELLPDLYKKVWNNRQKNIDYLKEKLSTEIPSFLLNKYQERYHNCQNAFEKLGAITEVDYEQLYLENDKKTPYLHTFKDILEESKNTEAITAYINSLDLDQQEKMSIQLTATEFFAQEKLYSASQKCLTHVEQFDKKDSLLKRQVENTKKQIKIIKTQNK